MTTLLDYILDYIRIYGIQVSAVVAVLTFLFSAYKYLAERRERHRWNEFVIFHRLVKDLVEPSDQNKSLYMDRQAAIIFELRNFRRYYPYSLRMLEGLRAEWNKVPDNYTRLLEEIDLTIAFLKSKVG